MKMTLINNGLYRRIQQQSFYLLLALLLCQAPTLSAAEDIRYISDVFYVPLRSGNSNKHRIIRKALKTGTRLTLLETDTASGFSRVTTNKGTEGWVESQYLSAQPIARTQLVNVRQQQSKSQKILAKLEKNNASIQQRNRKIQKQVALLSQQNQNLTAELASIKRVSANAIHLDTNNQALLQKNEILKIDIAELQADNARLADKSEKEWFIRGAIAVLIGVLLAILLPKLKPKNRLKEWT